MDMRRMRQPMEPKSQEMKNIINFIYLGQVIIPQSSMKEFLAVANDLEIEHLNHVLRNTKITEHEDRDEKSVSEDVMHAQKCMKSRSMEKLEGV